MPDTDQTTDWGSLVPTTRLGDQLYQRLAGLIEQGEFVAGSRLPAESELAERFRVSRPVIREALSRLRSAGMILSRRGSGSFVQKRADRVPLSLAIAGFGPVTSLAQVKQCYRFRLCVESEAAYYAAENRTPEVVEAMRGALDRLERAIASGLVGMEADFDFHAGVAKASGNEFFEGVMESMRMPLEFSINLARSLALRRPMEHLFTVHAEHIRILEAIERGDKEGSRTAMYTHVQNSCRRVFEGPNAPPLEPGALL